MEEQVFRSANDAPDAIAVPVRAWMQAGTFATVPVLTGLALVWRRPRLAGGFAVAGTAAWLLAKAVKPLVGRARPDGELEHVRIREGIAGDLGWVSGHTAVATTLIATAWPSLPPELRPLAAATIAATGFGRMYVGAHLPLDVVGGAGLGFVIAGFVRARSDSTRGRVVAWADLGDDHGEVGRARARR
jgi:glycosyltransferase 2 family protein